MDARNRIYEAYRSGASICTDTRKITKGCIFFALKGDNFNGNMFAQQALESGASLVVVDENLSTPNSQTVLVENVLVCLQELALHHRKNLKIPVVAITGSNGKTTTKELVSRVLSKKYRTIYTQGNLNNHIGVPLSLLTIRSEHEIAVIEMGANHRHEIAFLCSLALPTHVLITNVGMAHLEGFGGFEGVKMGKGEMYTYAKSNDALVFLNSDNTHLVKMLGGHDRVFSYGTTESCELIGKPDQWSKYAALQWRSKSMNEWRPLETKITGAYNFENIMAAIAVGVHFGVDANDIDEAINTYIPDNQRSQEIRFADTMVILDAYNANPTSMEAAIINFQSKVEGEKMIFLGQMLELGDTAAQEHERILKLALKTTANHVVAVGKNFNDMSHLIQDQRVTYLNDSLAAAVWLRKMLPKKCAILIKGSRGSKMELVLEAFK